MNYSVLLIFYLLIFAKVEMCVYVCVFCRIVLLQKNGRSWTAPEIIGMETS